GRRIMGVEGGCLYAVFGDKLPNARLNVPKTMRGIRGKSCETVGDTAVGINGLCWLLGAGDWGVLGNREGSLPDFFSFGSDQESTVDGVALQGSRNGGHERIFTQLERCLCGHHLLLEGDVGHLTGVLKASFPFTETLALEA